jgi:hypothetical protein
MFPLAVPYLPIPQACEIVSALAVRLYLPETGRVDREAISLNRVFAGVTVRAAPAAGGYSVVCSAKGLAPEFLSTVSLTFLLPRSRA